MILVLMTMLSACDFLNLPYGTKTAVPLTHVSAQDYYYPGLNYYNQGELDQALRDYK